MRRQLYILLQGFLVLLGCMSCSSEQDESYSVPPADDSVPVYRLRFDAGFKDYEGQDPSTRGADGMWENGEKVYFRFHEDKGDIMGVGIYESETDTWSIRPEKALAATDLSMCEALYFLEPAGETAFRVSLTTESVIYADTAATYMLYDDLLIVTAVLSPKTGRIRFKGTEGQAFSVNGLSYYTEYVFGDNSYSSKPLCFSSVVAADGYSPFAHAYFTDNANKTLTFDYTDNAVFQRTFPETTLRAGESGYVTIPTIDNISYWTLVNKKNLEEIVLPQTDVVTVASVRSATALLRSTIMSKGNGTVSDAGFVYSTSSVPSADNGTVVSCGTSTTMECRIKNLEPLTTYYAAAYVTNEKGTAWSNAVEFTTISMEEDKSSIEKGGFGDDDDLNGNSSSEGTINKGGFGDDDDDDLNGNSSSEGTINKGGFGDDDDLNGNSSSGGTINKGGFGDDDDLNGNTSSEGTIGRGGFDSDDNLNDTIPVQSSRSMSMIWQKIKVLMNKKN